MIPLNGNSPLLIAHRGATRYAPENSFEAVEKAAELGLEGVEVDLRITSDDHIVCFHDENIERVTGKHGKVSALTAAQLRAVILQSAAPENNHQLTGHTLFYSDLLDIASKQLFLNIELKGTKWRPDQIHRLLLEPIERRGMAEQILISSFHPWPLVHIKKMAPHFKTGLLLHPSHYRVGRPGWTAKWVKPDFINPPHHLATPRRIAFWKQEGYSVFVWTVNDRSLFEKLIAAGVDGIISDVPEDLNSKLE